MQPSAASNKPVARIARLRVIPLTVTMLSLIFVLKINEVYFSSRALIEILSVKDAQASSAPKKTEKKEKADGHGSSSGKEEAPVDESKKVYGRGKISREELEAIKKSQQATYTKSEIDLLQNLSKRREEIEQQKAELDMKNTVLDATEKRIDAKLQAMKELQDTLSKVVEEYKNQQHTEIMGLVKIYENMKPKDAAAIFNEMDMPILLEVIDKMSERKVAPVLAGMNPKRARDVTQELAELRRGRITVNNAAARAAGLPATQGNP